MFLKSQWLGSKTTLKENVKKKNRTSWDFPGGPVVKTLRFYCRRHKCDPWSGNHDPARRMAQPKPKGIKTELPAFL